MLSLSRPQRQALATLALVAGTVAPTCYVAWTAWKVNRPGHARDVETELSRQLGVQVSLASVRYPRPGEAVYRGVVLRQGEPRRRTFAEVARAEVVRLRRGDGELFLEAAGLRLRGEGGRQALEQLNGVLKRAGEVAWSRINLSAPGCEVELGEGASYAFHDLVATFQADPASPSVTASYHVDGATRCELTLARDRTADPVRTTLVLETKEGAPLPGRLLGPFFDPADWLGPEARVWGTLSLARAGEGDWEAEFRGDLTGIDLGTLVGRRYPDHRLTGLARLRVRSARWAKLPGGRNSGWVGAEGELVTGPGTISMSLVKALKARMRFRTLARLDDQEADLAFQRLGLGFTLRDSGELELRGGLGPETPPGAVIVDAEGLTPVLSAPHGTANVVGLVNTLTPGGDDTLVVPGTRESQGLQQYLPLPAGPRAALRANGN